LIDASFEACTIPFARCEIRSDSVAVACIVLALSFTVLRTVSTRVRKDEIAASIATTRDENDLLEPVITPADAHGRLSRLTREGLIRPARASLDRKLLSCRLPRAKRGGSALAALLQERRESR
jgi:hypothetical protein